MLYLQIPLTFYFIRVFDAVLIEMTDPGLDILPFLLSRPLGLKLVFSVLYFKVSDHIYK